MATFKCIVPATIDRDQLKNTLERGLLRVEARAKQNLTNDTATSTGQLRMSIETQVTDDGTTIRGKVGTTNPYALYVEYGTGIYASPLGTGSKAQQIPWTYHDDRRNQFFTTFGQQPKLFMHRAWNAEKQRLENDLGRALNNG